MTFEEIIANLPTSFLLLGGISVGSVPDRGAT